MLSPEAYGTHGNARELAVRHWGRGFPRMILLFMVREGSPLVKWGRGVRVGPPVFQEPVNGHFLAANDEREPADDPCGGEAGDLRFGQESLCEDDGTVAAREPLRSLREMAWPRQP